jgi:hypothetical protein
LNVGGVTKNRKKKKSLAARNLAAWRSGGVCASAAHLRQQRLLCR